MANFTDKIGELSWLGDPKYEGCGWVVVGEESSDSDSSYEPSAKEVAWNRAKSLLEQSDWAVLSDVPMSSGERAAWIEYRRALREIRLHPNFPDVTWPSRPV